MTSEGELDLLSTQEIVSLYAYKKDSKLQKIAF